MHGLVATPGAAEHYRQVGHAHVCLNKAAGVPVKTTALSGRLYFSSKGWLLLQVPNAIGTGAFDALDEAGVELPKSETTGRYNAHISVMRPEEVAKIGGPDKITERGHSYRYTLGAVKEVEPSGWGDTSKVWYITVESPELKELRRSYGLTALPHNDEFDFHITFGVRKKNVLRNGDVVKGQKAAADRPVRADAKDPVDRENCPHCDTPMERGDDGYCNRCGEPWPAKTAGLRALDALSSLLYVSPNEKLLDLLKTANGLPGMPAPAPAPAALAPAPVPKVPALQKARVGAGVVARAQAPVMARTYDAGKTLINDGFKPMMNLFSPGAPR